jgi:hypothetical protein
MTDMNSRRLRWVALALFASIAVNCLTIGLLVGRQTPSWLTGGKGQGQGGVQGAGNGFGQRVQLLPDDERRIFSQAMKPYRPGIWAARSALAEARLHLAEAIARHDYNPDEATAAFAEVRKRTTELQEKIQEATVVALGGLREESRNMLVSSPALVP